MKVLPHAQKRMETLSDFAPLTAFLVSGTLPITEDSFASIKGEREDIVRGLQFALWRLEAQRHWSRDTIWEDLKGLADALGVKVKDFLAPLFVAIAGSDASFSVVDSMDNARPGHEPGAYSSRHRGAGWRVQESGKAAGKRVPGTERYPGQPQRRIRSWRGICDITDFDPGARHQRYPEHAGCGQAEENACSCMTSKTAPTVGWCARR